MRRSTHVPKDLLTEEERRIREKQKELSQRRPLTYGTRPDPAHDQPEQRTTDEETSR